MNIRAKNYIKQTAIPSNSKREGKNLAIGLLNSNVEWDRLNIHLCGVRANFLTKDFIFSFLETLTNQAPLLLKDIKNITWVAENDQYEKLIKDWFDEFFKLW